MNVRVMVAEDEPNILESLSFLFGRAGFEVSVERDGRSALEAVLDRPPDVLVLDVMMPSLDGYEVLQRLRADSRTADLPVIVLTAKGQAEDRATALGHGADVFITKPFANSEIVEAVRALAGRVRSLS